MSQVSSAVADETWDICTRRVKRGTALHYPRGWPGMRLFVGIPIADAVVGELAAVAARLRADETRGGASAGGLRWTAPESWHITLQFLGNTSQEQCECLTARLREVRTATFEVQLGEMGYFDRAGVLFAEVPVTPKLAGLQQRIVTATSQCGFVGEARAFHPHITLARGTGNKGRSRRGDKKPDPAARGQSVERDRRLGELMARVGTRPAFTRFTAREFVLYESHLGPAGSRYEARARFKLQ